jgi:hypothetical protein
MDGIGMIIYPGDLYIPYGDQPTWWVEWTGHTYIYGWYADTPMRIGLFIL